MTVVYACLSLTDLFDDVTDGGLEELVHGLRSEPQHSLT